MKPAGLEAPSDSEHVEVHRKHRATGVARGAPSKLGAAVGVHEVHGEVVNMRGRGGARVAGRRPTDTREMERPRAGPTPPATTHATSPSPTLFIGGETANPSVAATTPHVAAGAEISSTSTTGAAG